MWIFNFKIIFKTWFTFFFTKIEKKWSFYSSNYVTWILQATFTPALLGATIKVSLWLVSSDCNLCRKNISEGKGVLCEVLWFFWGFYDIFVDLSERKKKLFWSGVFLTFFSQQPNGNRLQFPFNGYLSSTCCFGTHMKPNVTVIYSLICEWDYLINWNLSQCLLFIVYCL